MGSGFAKKKKEQKQMQEKFAEMQQKLKETKVTGQAGGGLVEITLNGEHEMVKIRIKKECVDPEDIEALEDLIRAAHTDATKKIEKAMSSSESAMPSAMGAFGKFGI